MIPKECKRLAEVDFPIAEVSKQATREKSIRHGHPSTLHLWWARRPLASSRADSNGIATARSLVTPTVQKQFKREARQILLGMGGRPRGWETTIELDEGLRQIILKFIANFANWNNAAKRTYLNVSRALVKAAHGEEPPLVVDPFAGGGSIPLEALRLGCEAFASDLNPVACLILKVMLEDIPRHGPDLSRGTAQSRWCDQAECQGGILSDLYPDDPDGAISDCVPLGAHGALRISELRCRDAAYALFLALQEGDKRKFALRHRVVRPRIGSPWIEFEIFEPKKDTEVHAGNRDTSQGDMRLLRIRCYPPGACASATYRAKRWCRRRV